MLRRAISAPAALTAGAITSRNIAVATARWRSGLMPTVLTYRPAASRPLLTNRREAPREGGVGDVPVAHVLDK